MIHLYCINYSSCPNRNALNEQATKNILYRSTFQLGNTMDDEHEQASSISEDIFDICTCMPFI